MSADLLAIGLPPSLGAPVADAMAPWGPVLPATDHDEALARGIRTCGNPMHRGSMTRQRPRASGPSIPARHSPSSAYMASGGSAHCARSRPRSSSVRPSRHESTNRSSFLPPETLGGSAQAAAPGPAPAAPEPETPTAPTPVVATAEPDAAPDTAEELALAKSIAEEATGEIARLRASARRHQLAAEAAHQDLAQTRAQAAEARRMAQRAEAQRDAVTTERDNLASTSPRCRTRLLPLAPRRVDSAGQLLEAEQEERIAEADRALALSMRCRLGGRTRGLPDRRLQDLSTARRTHRRRGATRTAQAEAAAFALPPTGC